MAHNACDGAADAHEEVIVQPVLEAALRVGSGTPCAAGPELATAPQPPLAFQLLCAALTR